MVNNIISVKSNKIHFSLIWLFTPSVEIVAKAASGSHLFHGCFHGLSQKWGKSAPIHAKKQKLYFA